MNQSIGGSGGTGAPATFFADMEKAETHHFGAIRAAADLAIQDSPASHVDIG